VLRALLFTPSCTERCYRCCAASASAASASPSRLSRASAATATRARRARVTTAGPVPVPLCALRAALAGSGCAAAQGRGTRDAWNAERSSRSPPALSRIADDARRRVWFDTTRRPSGPSLRRPARACAKKMLVVSAGGGESGRDKHARGGIGGCPHRNMHCHSARVCVVFVAPLQTNSQHNPQRQQRAAPSVSRTRPHSGVS
jgi:hypothetical protein